jgi:hypothetical protein
MMPLGPQRVVEQTHEAALKFVAEIDQQVST